MRLRLQRAGLHISPALVRTRSNAWRPSSWCLIWLSAPNLPFIVPAARVFVGPLGLPRWDRWPTE